MHSNTETYIAAVRTDQIAAFKRDLNPPTVILTVLLLSNNYWDMFHIKSNFQSEIKIAICCVPVFLFLFLGLVAEPEKNEYIFFLFVTLDQELQKNLLLAICILIMALTIKL